LFLLILTLSASYGYWGCILDYHPCEVAKNQNLLEVEAVRVNEPGRAIWAKISADFLRS
jgi:hypothetical protein